MSASQLRVLVCLAFLAALPVDVLLSSPPTQPLPPARERGYASPFAPLLRTTQRAGSMGLVPSSLAGRVAPQPAPW